MMRRASLLAAALACVAAAQFIPDKPVTIHPALESTPVRQGSMKSGPLGETRPAPLPPGRAGGARGGRAARSGPPIPPPPPAPEIGPAGAAAEQIAPGMRPAIAPLAAFDGLGDGFTSTGSGRGGAGRGGIDISLAVGPDHLFEILNGDMAVFTKKGRKYGATGKLLYGPVPNNTVFAGFGVRCGVSNNADSVVRYDQLANRDQWNRSEEPPEQPEPLRDLVRLNRH